MTSVDQQRFADLESFLNLLRNPLLPGAGGEIRRVHNERSPMKADQRTVLHPADDLYFQAMITGCLSRLAEIPCLIEAKPVKRPPLRDPGYDFCFAPVTSKAIPPTSISPPSIGGRGIRSWVSAVA